MIALATFTIHTDYYPIELVHTLWSQAKSKK